MIAPDAILGVGSALLAVSLIPAQKPPLGTSVSTCVILASFTYAYGVLDLWYALTTTAVTASLWGMLAAQRASW